MVHNVRIVVSTIIVVGTLLALNSAFATAPVPKPFVCSEHGKYELESSRHQSVWARVKNYHEKNEWTCSHGYYAPLKCWKQNEESSSPPSSEIKPRIDKTFYGLCRKSLDGPVGYYFDIRYYPEFIIDPKQWHFFK